MTGGQVVAAVVVKLNAAVVPTVYDGSGSTQASNYEQQWVSVGDPWDDDQEPVVVERVEIGAGPQWRLDYQIACKAYSGAGGDDITVHRAAASQLLAEIEAALNADRTLGGQVARARMGDVERWDEGRDEQGTGVRVGFTVDATLLP